MPKCISISFWKPLLASLCILLTTSACQDENGTTTDSTTPQDDAVEYCTRELVDAGTPCIEVTCGDNEGGCPFHSSCSDTEGYVWCTCDVGYEQKDNVGSTIELCVDSNECYGDPRGVCNNHGTCRDLDGTYECLCDEGYEIVEEGATCTDIDECDDDICQEHSSCSNIPGSYACVCDDGYELMDGICEFVGCLNVDCGLGACVQDGLDGVCECQDGAELIEGYCYDYDECDEEDYDCGDAGYCSNLSDGLGYSCTCDGGLEWDEEEGDCVDIDFCDRYGDLCGEHSYCEEIEEGADWECNCDDGYMLIDWGWSGYEWNHQEGGCRDINECEAIVEWHDEGLDWFEGCGTHGICVNTDGGAYCNCDPGYGQDSWGEACTDIDECNVSDSDPCGDNGECLDLLGSYDCDCNDGYTFTGGTCGDVNECDGDPCGDGGECTNSAGGYECSCSDGYYDTGSDCVLLYLTVWGDDGASQNADENTTDDPRAFTTDLPSVASHDVLFAEVETGYGSMCGRGADGQVWCVGYDGDSDSDSWYAIEDYEGEPITDAGSFSVGNGVGCMIREDQTGDNEVWCWGDPATGITGSLGEDYLVSLSGADLHRRAVPVVPNADSEDAIYGVQQVSVGNGNACIVTSDYKAMCWGTESKGELGRGDSNSYQNIRFIPDYVLTTGTSDTLTALTLVTEVQTSVNGNVTCALSGESDETTKAYCWGDNRVGQLGAGQEIVSTGSASRSVVAKAVRNSDNTADLVGFTGLSVGQDFGCGILPVEVSADVFKNAVWCWGNNASKQIGYLTTDFTTTNVAKEVFASSTPDDHLDALDVSAGMTAACIRTELDEEHIVKCWGTSTAGMLGTNTDTDHNYPVQVITTESDAPLIGVKDLSSRSENAATLTLDIWDEPI